MNVILSGTIMLRSLLNISKDVWVLCCPVEAMISIVQWKMLKCQTLPGADPGERKLQTYIYRREGVTWVNVTARLPRREVLFFLVKHVTLSRSFPKASFSSTPQMLSVSRCCRTDRGLSSAFLITTGRD